MTRDEWIAKARELLADQDDAQELLADSPDAPTVVVGELVEDDEPAETVGAKPSPAVVSVELAPRAREARPGRPPGVLARMGRFAARKLTEPDEAEAPLYGTERLEVGVHNLTEKAVDRGLDALQGAKAKLPQLRDRGAAFRGRRLGRAKG